VGQVDVHDFDSGLDWSLPQQQLQHTCNMFPLHRIHMTLLTAALLVFEAVLEEADIVEQALMKIVL